MKQPIEVYQTFDPKHFSERSWGSEPTREKLAQRYRRLLKSQAAIINSVLWGEARSEELPTQFYKDLGELVGHELRYPLFEDGEHNQVLSPPRSLFYIYGNDNQSNIRYLEIVTDRVVRVVSPNYYKFKFFNRGDESKEKPYIEWGKDMFLDSLLNIFGGDFIRYVGRLPKASPEYDPEKILRVIGSSDANAILFWTFAPYIHEQFKRNGMTAEQSLDTLLDWVKDAIDDNVTTTPTLRRPNLTYFGIHDIDENLITGYSEKMPSHLRARLIAPILVPEVFHLGRREQFSFEFVH